MTISLCMIVRDEALNLPACLASVGDLASELIVLDTGSTDQSRAIAQAHGAQVHDFEWVEDFAVARNAALRYATGDWILVLDGDETLTPAGATLLRALDQGEALERIPAQEILLVNLLRLEVGAQQSPYTLVSRFFRNRPEICFSRPYHETVDDSILALQAQEPHWQVVNCTAIALHHYGYQSDAIAHRQKFDRARHILAAHLAHHPEDGYSHNKLGALYGQAGDWGRAIAHLHQGLASPGVDPLTRYELHYHLGLAHRHRQQMAAAEQHYLAAIASPILAPLKLGAVINLGSLYKQTGQWAAAIAQFEQAIAIDPQAAIAHFNLGVVYRTQGALDRALVAYQRAIDCQPDYAEAHQNLGVTLFKLGKLPECQRAFQQAIQLYERSNPEAAQKLRLGIHNLGIAGAFKPPS